jgi:hypothetical protein
MFHAELPGTQPNALSVWPGKIISFCGGLRFPKAGLAEVLLGH